MSDAKTLERARRTYRKIKADPIRYSRRLRLANENAKKRYAILKSNPVWWRYYKRKNNLNTRRWYWANRAKAMKASVQWAEANREKSKQIKIKSANKHKVSCALCGGMKAKVSTMCHSCYFLGRYLQREFTDKLSIFKALSEMDMQTINELKRKHRELRRSNKKHRQTASLLR